MLNLTLFLIDELLKGRLAFLLLLLFFGDIKDYAFEDGRKKCMYRTYGSMIGEVEGSREIAESIEESVVAV
jgi:hypothetical protein